VTNTTIDTRLDGFARRLESDAGGSISLLVYGSVARGDWHEGQSDINLLLVVSDTSPAALARLTPAVEEWHRQGFTPPLLIGTDEWRRAVDVFPIEIVDMQLAHRMLAGSDPLTNVRVNPADLRHALETALRGKLVRLRQAYVRFASSPMTLGSFVSATLSELLVLLRCMAVLMGRTDANDAAGTVRAVGDVLGDSADALLEMVAHRREPEWGCSPELFARYLEAVRCAAEAVDTYPVGG
jgi:hypothetical protein